MYNTFNVFAVDDQMEVTPTQPKRESKPPPIYVKHVTKYADLCSALTLIVGKGAHDS